MAIDWAREAEADFRGGAPGATPPSPPLDTGVSYYDPDQLLAAGVPEVQVNAYRAATAALREAQARAQAAGGDIFTGQGLSAAARQEAAAALSSVKSLEAAINQHLRTVPPQRPIQWTDKNGARYSYDPATGETTQLTPPPTRPYEPKAPSPSGLDRSDRFFWDPNFIDPETGVRGGLRENPGYDPTLADLDKRLKEAQIAASLRGPQGKTDSPLDWAKWNVEQERYPIEQARDEERWQKTYQAQEADRAARRREALMNAAVSLAGNIGQDWSRNLPYGAMQGQQYLMGGEPGGVYENILRGYGMKYDPNTFRIQQVEYDPLAPWRWAQGALGVG